MTLQTDTMPARIQITCLAALFATFGCSEPPPPPAPTVTVARDMKRVPGSTYRMGSDLAELKKISAAAGLSSIETLLAEVPSRSVSVQDFYIDTFDVNNRQYSRFVDAVPGWRKNKLDPSQQNGRYLEHWADGDPPKALLLHPVTFITWQAAAAYCEWRERRLPTEIEYEWAAQDGESQAQYPWGDAPPDGDLVNWGGDRIRSTSPVGSYPPNKRGLYDMTGNVWKFTADPWLGSYEDMLAGEVTADIASADPNARRVVKGGSWEANAANLRVRYRDSHKSFDAREMVGFRCAKSADAR
jgi:formylglycine-generating enzyme required for sulfatase activity